MPVKPCPYRSASEAARSKSFFPRGVSRSMRRPRRDYDGRGNYSRSETLRYSAGAGLGIEIPNDELWLAPRVSRGRRCWRGQGLA